MSNLSDRISPDCIGYRYLKEADEIKCFLLANVIWMTEDEIISNLFNLKKINENYRFYLILDLVI